MALRRRHAIGGERGVKKGGPEKTAQGPALPLKDPPHPMRQEEHAGAGLFTLLLLSAAAAD